jgi:DNA-binding response OmpR family regulator
MNKILIIEDDKTIVEGLTTALEFHGYEVLAAYNGSEGLKLLSGRKPDLVILDIMLPDHDGFEICKRIRQQQGHLPIIMLTARSEESDKLLGFELGADDYVTKPFSARELMARVRAVLKRSVPAPQLPQTVHIGSAAVHLEDFTISRGDREYPLSPKEQAILKLLVDHPDTVISRERIIDEVWGDEYFPTPKTIDNFIRKLRLKIEEAAAAPRHILTVHGVGYKLKIRE